MQQYPQMDAVFAANDHTAIGVLQLAQQLGLSIPDDIGVVGFDDIHMARSFTPPITTVRQNFREFGTRGVTKLVGMINGEADEINSAIKSELMVRASSLRPLQKKTK